MVKKSGPKPFTFEGDKATNSWLSSLEPSTRNNYTVHWKRFLVWAGLTGDQILENVKTVSKGEWEAKVMQYKTWLSQQKSRKGEPLSDYFVRQSTVAVRSF